MTVSSICDFLAKKHPPFQEKYRQKLLRNVLYFNTKGNTKSVWVFPLRAEIGFSLSSLYFIARDILCTQAYVYLDHPQLLLAPLFSRFFEKGQPFIY